MTSAPYNPETLNKIRDGARAHDLGWDDAFYHSICRKHGLTPKRLCVVIASPPTEDYAPKPILSAAKVKAALLPPLDKRQHVALAVPDWLADELNAIKVSKRGALTMFIRRAIHNALQSNDKLPDWRRGNDPARATINCTLTDDEMARLQRHLQGSDHTISEFMRRAVLKALQREEVQAL